MISVSRFSGFLSPFLLWSPLLVLSQRLACLPLNYLIEILGDPLLYFVQLRSIPLYFNLLPWVAWSLTIALTWTFSWSNLSTTNLIFRRHENNWNVRQSQNWMEWRKCVRERISREFIAVFRLFLRACERKFLTFMLRYTIYVLFLDLNWGCRVAPLCKSQMM